MLRNKLLPFFGLGTREQRAWAMYDWANSAYATIIMAALLPPFFSAYYATDLEPGQATTIYAKTISLALFITALFSPLLGALADNRGRRKIYLFSTTLAGSIFTAGFFFVPQGGWLWACGLIVLTNMCFGWSLVFYESLLPGLSTPDTADEVSSAGYALGYLGGGIAFLISVVGILAAIHWSFAEQSFMARCSYVLAGVWWLAFSIPLFRQVPEPAARKPEPVLKAIGSAFRNLEATFSDIRKHKNLFLFLLAFWFYNDGIGTVIKMAAIFAAEIGINTDHLMIALLITQFIAFPFALLFGWIGKRFGTKRGIYIALMVYLVILLRAYYMQTSRDFFILASMVGMVQGGAQALSRSMFTRMVPKEKTGEFFGFFSVSSKFATVFGPIIFALVNQWTGNSRYGILSIGVFFIVGMVLLRYVATDDLGRER